MPRGSAAFGCLALGDLVLFEATGCVMVDATVDKELAVGRRDKLLDFMDAIAAADRMMVRSDIRLKHFVDVRTLRVRVLTPRTEWRETNGESGEALSTGDPR